jgi:hypothetical protein
MSKDSSLFKAASELCSALGDSRQASKVQCKIDNLKKALSAYDNTPEPTSEGKEETWRTIDKMTLELEEKMNEYYPKPKPLTWKVRLTEETSEQSKPTPSPNPRQGEEITFTQEEVYQLFKALYVDIAHGDDEHRQWLKNKIQHFYSTEVEKHSIVKTIPNE